MVAVKERTGWVQDVPLTEDESRFQVKGFGDKGVRENQKRIQSLIDQSTQQLNKGNKADAAKKLIEAYDATDLRDGSGKVMDGGQGDARLKAALALRVGDLYRESAAESAEQSKASDAYKEAASWYKKSLGNHQGTSSVQEVHNGLGVCQYALGDAKDAYKSFEKAISANDERMKLVRALVAKDPQDGLAKGELSKLIENQRSYQNNRGVAAYTTGQNADEERLVYSRRHAAEIIKEAFSERTDEHLGQLKCGNRTVCENAAQISAEIASENTEAVKLMHDAQEGQKAAPTTGGITDQLRNSPRWRVLLKEGVKVDNEIQRNIAEQALGEETQESLALQKQAQERLGELPAAERADAAGRATLRQRLKTLALSAMERFRTKPAEGGETQELAQPQADAPAIIAQTYQGPAPPIIAEVNAQQAAPPVMSEPKEERAVRRKKKERREERIGGKWDYVAMDAHGKELKGTIEVATQSDAIGKVKEMGLFPTKITHRDGSERKDDDLVSRGLDRLQDLAYWLEDRFDDLRERLSRGAKPKTATP